MLTLAASCHSHYPEGMSWAERKKYYDDYNKAYMEKKLSASARKADTLLQVSKVRAKPEAVSTSVAFSIRNNSILPQKIEIDGNVLKFNPLEVRYVGFAAGTKAYWYHKTFRLGRGKFLFEVKEKDRDKRFTLFN
jgi:hypothetical protein